MKLLGLVLEDVLHLYELKFPISSGQCPMLIGICSTKSN